MINIKKLFSSKFSKKFNTSNDNNEDINNFSSKPKIYVNNNELYTNISYIEELIIDLNKVDFGINSDEFEVLFDENLRSKEREIAFYNKLENLKEKHYYINENVIKNIETNLNYKTTRYNFFKKINKGTDYISILKGAKFEYLVACLFKYSSRYNLQRIDIMAGYDDNGVDIILTKKDQTIINVQCKYRDISKTPVDYFIREKYNGMASNLNRSSKDNRNIIITTSYFHCQVYDYAKKDNIELIDRHSLMLLLAETFPEQLANAYHDSVETIKKDDICKNCGFSRYIKVKGNKTYDFCINCHNSIKFSGKKNTTL